MSSVADWAGRLEAREREKSGVRLKIARQAVARRLGIAPGTLENLARGRSKGVRDWVRDRIHAALIRETETEIRRLEHELETLRLVGGDARMAEMGEVAAHLATARALLNGEKP